jgi:hypothetical protein
VYSYATPSEEYSQQKQVWGGKYVIKRISHVLECDMIFIQLVCFLSPLQGSGNKPHKSLDKNHITSQTMGDPIYTCIINQSINEICNNPATPTFSVVVGLAFKSSHTHSMLLFNESTKYAHHKQ